MTKILLPLIGVFALVILLNGLITVSSQDVVENEQVETMQNMDPTGTSWEVREINYTSGSRSDFTENEHVVAFDNGLFSISSECGLKQGTYEYIADDREILFENISDPIGSCADSDRRKELLGALQQVRSLRYVDPVDNLPTSLVLIVGPDSYQVVLDRVQ